MIKRDLESELLRISNVFSVVTLTGPRQSGKTTLCKKVFPNYHYVNLERITDREIISQNPENYINTHRTGLIIDEVHHLPELFSIIQIVVDENPESQIILTGSSNFQLLEKITQSLAGRTALLTLLPLSHQELLQEIKELSTNQIIINGGYPAIWSGKMNAQDFCQNYYNTYIERDVKQLINVKSMSAFQRFLKLCAGRIGTELNNSSLASDVGVSVSTIQEWISVLQASYILYLLPPFYRNIRKRIVKSSKIYFYDTALACYLLNIENESHIDNHPLRGNIFENMVVNQFITARTNKGKNSNVFFYKDKSQKEVDVVLENGNELSIYEIKSAMLFNTSFFNNLNYLKNLFGDQIISSNLIYDGITEHNTTENGIFNFRNINFYPQTP